MLHLVALFSGTKCNPKDYDQGEVTTEFPSLRFTLEGGIMKSDLKFTGPTLFGPLHNWLHDLAVALGLIPPPLQPVPIPTEDDRRRQKPRR